ncbi:MAG: acylphosphatase [Methyloligella sp. ZOD6]
MVSDSEDIRTVTVRIEGRVQGVYFRAWTERTAKELNLDGWVRNCDDGSVAAVFSGPPEVVADMLRRCEEGSPGAQVSQVLILDEGGTPPDGFQVIATDNYK